MCLEIYSFVYHILYNDDGNFQCEQVSPVGQSHSESDDDAGRRWDWRDLYPHVVRNVLFI